MPLQHDTTECGTARNCSGVYRPHRLCRRSSGRLEETSLAKCQQLLKAGRLAEFRGEQVNFEEDLVADVGSFETAHHPARSTTSGLNSSPESSANCCWKGELHVFPHLASPKTSSSWDIQGTCGTSAVFSVPPHLPLQHDENVIELSHQRRLRYFRDLPQREDENGRRKENHGTAIGKRKEA